MVIGEHNVKKWEDGDDNDDDDDNVDDLMSMPCVCRSVTITLAAETQLLCPLSPHIYTTKHNYTEVYAQYAIIRNKTQLYTATQ